MEKLLAGKADQIVLFKAGEMAKGTVIDVTPHRILVSLPGGQTGIVTKKEASGFGVEVDDVEVGSNIEALVMDPENELGLVALSLRRANQELVWAELQEAMAEETIITVKVSEANKGGLMARYKGLKAFLPVSQLTPMNYPRVDGADAGEILRRLGSHIGSEFTVRVINADRTNGKLIVSEKAAIAEQRKETFAKLQSGDIVKGTVSGIVKFGIFVTFDGVEGLVHLSELDWGHVSDPGKMYSVRDKVEVLVLSIEGEKLSLSIKKLTEDPWKELVKGFEAGSKLEGKVVRWNANGVFVELKKDVTGLIPLAQFGVSDYSELKVKEGEKIAGEVVSINYDSHRIMLKKEGYVAPVANEAAAE